MVDKFPLKAEQDLKFYVFQVLPKGIQISIPADYISCVSFNLETAAGSILNQYKAKNLDISLNQCIALPVTAILDMLKLPEEPVKEIQMTVAPMVEEPKKDLTRADFINGLKLVVDKYIQDKDKRTAIKAILIDAEQVPEKKTPRKRGEKGR